MMPRPLLADDLMTATPLTLTRMHRAALTLLLAAGGPALAQQTFPVVNPPMRGGFVSVAPSQPRPQEPLLLGFTYQAREAGYTPAAEVATGEGSIDVYLRDPCVEPGANCGGPGQYMPVLIALNGVDTAGDYVVRVFSGQTPSSPLIELAGFEVGGTNLGLTAPQPADGYWLDPNQPGSGFMLDRQSGVWAVGHYNYLPTGADAFAGEAAWQLGVGPLRRDSLLLPMDYYAGGGCFGCTNYVEPGAVRTVGLLRLRFESARRGWLQINGARETPVTSLPFGAAYAPVSLEDAGDPTFGALQLPDPRGEWLLADDFGHSAVVRFAEPPQLPQTDLDPPIRYIGSVIGANFPVANLTCTEGEASNLAFGNPGKPAMCRLLAVAAVGINNGVLLGDFELANIDEDRMQGRVGSADGAQGTVLMRRVRTVGELQ